MSLSTGSYVNGQWTSRHVDIHHILAQNREDSPQEKELSALDTPPRLPVMGILTQTLIQSPVVKWIIPARIRHESKNDVLFIHDTFIEIKEIEEGSRDGQMRTVAVKMDFDSSIQSARVFGLPRKYTNPLLEGQDVIIKAEQMEGVELFTPPQSELPPHILVLALESKKLVFLVSYHDKDDHICFISYERPLPVHQPSPDQPGEYFAITPKHIAVDPQSRAMALASLKGSLTLYALKSMSELKREVEHNGNLYGDRFEPVREEKHLSVDGKIEKMEFLHSPEGDDEHVVLLLIVYKDEKPKLICYEWDSGKGLVTVQAKVNGRLHLADRDVPLLLIPLTKSTAFMLVSVQQITVYRGILTGQAKAYILPIYAHEPPEEPGRTTKPPVWTQWARPSRHDLHVQKQDNIYLCREDGVVHFLEIMDNLEQMLECTHMVGMLGINVDTSFASIDLGSRGCDLLVAGGDFCDGGGWLFEPRRSAQKQFNLPNWTPLIDYAAVSVAKNSECKSSRELQISNTEQSPPRFFASTGQGSRHGAVTEIRYGIEAPKEIALELSQAGVIQLWALEFVLDSSYRAVMMIFLSYPTSTLVLMFDMEGNTHEDVIDIEFNARTIAVGTSKNGLIVQITDKSITAVQPYHKMKRIFNLHILAACIKTLEEQDIETVVLTAVREEEKVFLCFGCLGFDGQQIYYHLIGERIHLSSEPSAMSLEIIEGKLTTFVGTLTSKLQIYQADPECGLSLALEYSFDGQVAICDSLSVLATNMLDSTDKCRILCGLRNGFIEILEVKSESSGSKIVCFCEKIQLGNTSATILTDNTKSSRAIILCEQKLRILEYSSDQVVGFRGHANVNNIWLTDSDLPWFQHGPIEALSQASSGFASGWLICAEKNQLHIATLPLDSKPSNVSRRRPVKGSPRRVIYSPRLRKLIVLCEEVSISPLKGLKGYSSRSNQRCLKPMILFVDPESDMSDSDEKDRLPIKACQPGERFLGVAEWYLDVDDQIKHILVINTTLENMPHSPSGRILLFHVSTEGELTLRTTVNRDFPVYDLIPYSTRSLLYCCGLDLCLHTLTIIPEKLERSRWHDPVIFHLGSSGRHLSVNDSFVYVSTVGNGLSIFKIEDNNIIPQFNDESARDDLYHLNMPERSLILTSQRNRSVAGLWQPPQKRINNSTSTVFEAMLTGSITRFRRINRPLWQQSLKADTMKENIIGCSTDGTMHQFEILDESSWRLLLFVQNLVTRSPTICPHANLAQSYRRALEPSSKNPLNMHVNGDILHRLFERDGERILISLLEDQSILDIISAQEPIFRIVLAQHPRCCSTMEAKSLTRELVTRELATIEGAARRRLFRKFAKGVGLENDSDSDDWVRQVLGWIELKIRKVM